MGRRSEIEGARGATCMHACKLQARVVVHLRVRMLLRVVVHLRVRMLLDGAAVQAGGHGCGISAGSSRPSTWS